MDVGGLLFISPSSRTLSGMQGKYWLYGVSSSLARQFMQRKNFRILHNLSPFLIELTGIFNIKAQ